MTAAPAIDPALAVGTWRASSASVRVNYTDADGGEANRSVRVAHLVRGEHTACGRSTRHFTWVDTDARATLRCRPCADVDGAATHRDMCDAAGITYRQLDHWTRQRWLRAHDTLPGSGTRRTYPFDELDVAVRMGELTRAGVAASVAAELARQPRDLELAWAAGRGECA